MLEFFLSYLLVYKYIVIFIVVFTASFGLPIPATAVVMAAGAFAAQGYLDSLTILLFTISASITGDILGYSIAFKYGRPIFYRFGFTKFFKSSAFLLVENMFIKHRYMTIFITRFLATGLGPSTNFLAGLTKIRFRNFFLIALAGEIIYSVLFMSLGFAFSEQWESILNISENIIGIIILIFFLGILIKILLHPKKKISKQINLG